MVNDRTKKHQTWECAKDTVFTTVGRAEETKKLNPMLIDETALRIIEQVDFDFSQMTQNIDDLTQLAWIKRSLYSDQVMMEFLTKYPEGTIVNIG